MFFGDLEFFQGSDSSGEQTSEEAAEKFREQMRAASAQMQALQKGEQKKKKKEDRLTKIMNNLFKSKTKSGLIIAAMRVLAENIPPIFVLGVMTLIDPEILEETKKSIEQEGKRLSPVPFEEGDGQMADWVNIMAEYAGRDPVKFINNVKNQEKKLKYVLVDFVKNVIQEYDNGKSAEQAEELAIEILRKIIHHMEQNFEHLVQLHEEDLGGPMQ